MAAAGRYLSFFFLFTCNRLPDACGGATSGYPQLLLPNLTVRIAWSVTARSLHE